MPEPRGPAADPKYPPSISDSNPYNFTPQLLEASRLPPKVTDNHVFFLGHEGPWDQTCFSQWFPAAFFAPQDPYKGDMSLVEFPTAEHYMMYHKALLMGDKDASQKILAESHPSVAKRLGREVKRFDRELWAKHADRVVVEGNLAKFEQNGDLRSILLATGNRMLVEARIWGIGFNATDAESHQSEWGSNRVGKALMDVRDSMSK